MKIQVKRTIDAPAKDLWAYLADYSNIHRFHPMINSSHWVGANQSCEVGSTRQCNFNDGSYFKEQITDWQEGKSYSLKVIETDAQVKEASATLALRKISNTRTEVTMKLELIPKNKAMAPMMYLMFKYKAVPSILKGLEDIFVSEHKSTTGFKVAS